MRHPEFWISVIASVLLALGCEGDGETPDDCSRAFDPVPELHDATVSAAERWSTATGCAITVAAGGMPVELVPVVVDVEGERRGGLTRRENGVPVRVLVSGESPDPWRTVAHEMGHALGGDGHTSRGVLADTMNDPALDTVINFEALELVCTNLPCRLMLAE